MLNFIITIIFNALAIFLADALLPGFVFQGSLIFLFLAGLILGLINALLKPILKFIFSPLILLTIGLFTIIINVLLIWLLEALVEPLVITGLTTYFWTVVIVSLANMLANRCKVKNKK